MRKLSKAKPKPRDELDALVRKWRMSLQYWYTYPAAQAWHARDYCGDIVEYGQTPLSAARKLARRLEKEGKR